MATSAQLGFTLLSEGQASAEITANEAFGYLDGFGNLSIKDRDLATPPGSPAEGDRYLIAASPTGAWAGQAGKLTIYLSGWRFITAREGMISWIDDENKLIRYDGSAWKEIALVVANTKSLSILNPGAAENVTMFYTTVAITITRATAVVRGTTPSVTYQIKHDTSRAGAGNNLFSSGQVVTNTTTGAIVTSGFNDATIPALSFVWFTTSAASGTNLEISVTLNFTED